MNCNIILLITQMKKKRQKILRGIRILRSYVRCIANNSDGGYLVHIIRKICIKPQLQSYILFSFDP